PPPPPGNVPLFDPAQIPQGSLRQKLEQAHQSRGAACSSCHALLDPMGFGLEHYDAVGAWRENDNGFAIDATGIVPGSTRAFDGADTLSAALAGDERFNRCVAKKLLGYA